MKDTPPWESRLLIPKHLAKHPRHIILHRWKHM
jgi:hypothetical protein